MSQALHPMLNIAIKAARGGGDHQPRGSLDLEVLKIGTKGPNDFVSEVDRAAEQAIIETLLDRLPRPRHPGRGVRPRTRRQAQRVTSGSSTRWTAPPTSCTASRCMRVHRAGAPRPGAAGRGLRPHAQRPVLRQQGRGAFLNDRRLRVSKRTRLADALIGTGFPFRKGDNFKRYVKMFEEVMQSCAGLRRPGAAALDLCYVAAGYYDGFFETGLNPWDVAAGSLIITEAGGLIGNFTGDSRLPVPARGGGRQPQGLRPAGADAGALQRASARWTHHRPQTAAPRHVHRARPAPISTTARATPASRRPAGRCPSAATTDRRLAAWATHPAGPARHNAGMNFEWTNPYPTVRSPVMARNVVATSQPLASQAGLRMLQQGRQCHRRRDCRPPRLHDDRRAHLERSGQ
jgi:myo-inositol-1(or 4)-monophosphatase